MATIINLRQARKDRERAKREALAAEQRARFGRPATEREHTAATEALSERRLDGVLRDGTGASRGAPGKDQSS